MMMRCRVFVSLLLHSHLFLFFFQRLHWKKIFFFFEPIVCLNTWTCHQSYQLGLLSCWRTTSSQPAQLHAPLSPDRQCREGLQDGVWILALCKEHTHTASTCHQLPALQVKAGGLSTVFECYKNLQADKIHWDVETALLSSLSTGRWTELSVWVLGDVGAGSTRQQFPSQPDGKHRQRQFPSSSIQSCTWKPCSLSIPNSWFCFLLNINLTPK